MPALGSAPSRRRALIVGVLAAAIPGAALAQTGTSSVSTSSASAPAAAPPAASVSTTAPVSPPHALAEPIGVPVESDRSWLDDLRYEVMYLSTLRWQQDNGDRTGPFIPDEVGPNGAPVQNPRWDPTGENFGDIIQTFGASVGYKRWLFALRLDTAHYIHKPVADPSASTRIQGFLRDRYVNQIRPEYIALTYSGRDVSFTAGDFYMTLGRGMILSIRKVGDVGIDNKLTGALLKSRVKLGGKSELSFTEFGGWLNIKNYESGTGFYYPERLNPADDDNRRWDALDFIAGGRVQYRYGKYLKLGAHAASIQSPDDLAGQSAVVNGFGANLELPRPVKWFSFYAEVARIIREDTRRDDPERGFATYVNSNFYLGKATLLLEGKYYRNMFNVVPTGIRQATRQVLNRLIDPPTAERPLTILLANTTVAGGRARLDYRLAPGIVPYIAGGAYWDESFSFSPGGEPLASPPKIIGAIYGGGRLVKKWSEITFEAGFRTQRNQFPEDRRTPSDEVDERTAQQNSDVNGAIFREDVHAILDWRAPLFGKYSFELALNWLFAKQENSIVDCEDFDSDPDFYRDPADPDLFDRVSNACGGRSSDKRFVDLPDTWHEGRVALSFISSDKWSVTGAWEFYTQQPDVFDQHYFSIAAQYEFMQGGIVRAMYGGERAGLKCSGGVCRFFPGFEGGRVEINMRY